MVENHFITNKMSELSNTEILIFLGLVVFTIIIASAFFTTQRTQYGVWETIFDTGCLNGDQPCTVRGEQTIIQQCIPGPNNTPCRTATGINTYANQTLTSKCVTTCQLSNWQNIEGACTIPGNEKGCYDPFTMTAQQEVTKMCVAVDSSGLNNCIIFDDTTQTSKTYNIGDVVKVVEDCFDPANPLCGEWVMSGGTKEDIGICFFNSSLTPNPGCVVSDGGLGEGFIGTQMSCLTVDGELITPTPSDPTLQLCPKIPCSDVVVTPDMKVPDNPVICANNPQCLYACRLSPFTNTGSSTLDSVVNKLLILTSNDDSTVITAYNTPQNPPSETRFHPPPPPTEIDEAYQPVALISTSTSFNTGTCSTQQVIFNTGIIMQVAPISGTLCKIFLIVNVGYNGWLGKDSKNVAQWVQAQSIYQGVGIRKSDAMLFNVITDGSTMTITDSVGAPVFVIDDNNNLVALSSLKVNAFPLDTNYESRLDSPCNKLL
jgi:hypothetical protein